MGPRQEERGPETRPTPILTGRKRAEFEREATQVLRAHGVDIVLCVGFMRILSPSPHRSAC